MPSIHFSDLVVMTAGEMSQIPATQGVEPDDLPDLLAQANLPESASELTSELSLPSLILDEIAIDLPVHFHLSPRSTGSLATARLMTTLPSPLVTKSVNALSHFRVTLKLNP
ncbi:MAG: hypothetical protein KME12_16480 [Trichocoleus desertorum ATA4-8-CV12]|jgi:hypothetical protein|nr:hypothetical protein [Trichocoleus desertorum ATA4-8-CV12]